MIATGNTPLLSTPSIRVLAVELALRAYAPALNSTRNNNSLLLKCRLNPQHWWEMIQKSYATETSPREIITFLKFLKARYCIKNWLNKVPGTI